MIPDSKFVSLDTEGRQIGFHPNLQPPFYQGIAIPDCDIIRDDAFCTKCDAAQENANNQNLIYSVIYMAQSAAGRAAIKTISDHHIKIGYHESFQRDGTPQAGYRNGVAYILVDPATPPSIQHLVLIQQAAQFAATLQLVTRPVAALPEAAALIAQASTICGVIALVDHGEECLANRRESPERFVPPDLEGTMARLLSNPALADLIPKEAQDRAGYKSRILAGETLKDLLGQGPGLSCGHVPR